MAYALCLVLFLITFFSAKERIQPIFVQLDSLAAVEPIQRRLRIRKQAPAIESGVLESGPGQDPISKRTRDSDTGKCTTEHAQEVVPPGIRVG